MFLFFNFIYLTLSCIRTNISFHLNEKNVNKELFTAAQQGLISWVKTNLGMLLEVLDSVWVIVKQNLNVITSIIGTFLSIFLGGGQAVITFLLDAVSSIFSSNFIDKCFNDFYFYYFLAHFSHSIILLIE